MPRGGARVFALSRLGAAVVAGASARVAADGTITVIPWWQSSRFVILIRLNDRLTEGYV